MTYYAKKRGRRVSVKHRLAESYESRLLALMSRLAPLAARYHTTLSKATGPRLCRHKVRPEYCICCRAPDISVSFTALIRACRGGKAFRQSIVREVKREQYGQLVNAAL